MKLATMRTGQKRSEATVEKRLYAVVTISGWGECRLDEEEMLCVSVPLNLRKALASTGRFVGAACASAPQNHSLHFPPGEREPGGGSEAETQRSRDSKHDGRCVCSCSTAVRSPSTRSS